MQSLFDCFVQWDKADDKLAISGLGFAALLVLWATTGLINVSAIFFRVEKRKHPVRFRILWMSHDFIYQSRSQFKTRSVNCSHIVACIIALCRLLINCP